MVRHGWGAAGVLLVTAVLLVTVAPASGGASAGFLQEDGTQVTPDRVVIRLDVQPDGTARWQVEYRVALDDANASGAFEAVRRNVTANPLTYAGQFHDRQQPAIAAAENASGREMALRNVSVDATRRQLAGVPDEYGSLTYTFEWANFGATENGRVTAGDALVGFFLREEWTLIVAWPEDYRPVETVPAPDEQRDRAAVWRGPKEFSTDGPRVVLEPTGAAGGVRLPVVPLALAAGVVVALLVAVGWYRREDLPLPAPSGGDAAVGTGDGATDAAASSGAAAGERDEPPEDLLSDEERVVRLLEERGGRMKQQEVVAALEWSETKTSQVVRELHEAEEIERYRLGRENVLALPGEIDV